MLDRERPGAVRLYGNFITDPAEAYPVARRRFDLLGYTPLFRQGRERQLIVAVPGELPKEEPRPKLALGLFLAALVSTTVVGVMMEWRPERSLWQNLLAGLPFSLSLMAILGAHEMGHYLVARHFGVPVSLPYFIPLPLPPLGTMGAFISMKAPPQNKRHLLAVGMAGPLAGLAVAIPVLILGLSLSSVGPPPTNEPYLLEGNSLLYALLKIALFGRFLPSGGVDVFLHSVAFAGWAGLLVTGLNLIPAGQLDGGHVAYALLGRWARYVTWAFIIVLAFLGFIWPGWFLWSALVFFLGRRSQAPLNDLTKLEPWQVVTAILILILFVLTFVPIPFQSVTPPGVQSLFDLLLGT